MFEHLAADVACIEVGKDEDVGLAGDGRARRPVGSIGRDQGHVDFHFAVIDKVDIAVAQDLHGTAHFLGAGTAFAAHGRIGKQGYFRLRDMQGAARPVDAVHGNVGQLVFVGVWDNVAVADDENAVMAELHHVRHDDEGAADRIDIGARADDLQGRAQHFRSRRLHAGHHAGCFSGSDQGSAEIKRMLQ